MKVSEKVMGDLKNPKRINILTTADKTNAPNVAIFGSPKLTEEHTISLVIRDATRSYANLKENPKASILVLIPGEKPSKALGCRLYLKVNRIELSRNPIYLHKRSDKGEQTWEAGFNKTLEENTEARKDQDAHLVIFDIVDARPIIDMGQGV